MAFSRSCTYTLFIPQGVEIELFSLYRQLFLRHMQTDFQTLYGQLFLRHMQTDFQNFPIWA